MNEDLKKELDFLIENTAGRNKDQVYNECKNAMMDFQMRFFVNINYDTCIGYILGKLRF